MIDFAGLDDLPHQRHGVVGHGETQVGETRGETRHAQHPHRILDESRRDMAQHPGLDIAGPSNGSISRPSCILGDGIDGEIAPFQILLQRHRWARHGTRNRGSRVRSCARCAPARVPLSFRGCRNTGKSLPTAGSLRLHVLGRGADHHEIAVGHRAAQQLVADRAADQIDLHEGIVAWRRTGDVTRVPSRRSGGRGGSGLQPVMPVKLPLSCVAAARAIVRATDRNRGCGCCRRTGRAASRQRDAARCRVCPGRRGCRPSRCAG